MFKQINGKRRAKNSSTHPITHVSNQRQQRLFLSTHELSAGFLTILPFQSLDNVELLQTPVSEMIWYGIGNDWLGTLLTVYKRAATMTVVSIMHATAVRA